MHKLTVPLCFLLASAAQASVGTQVKGVFQGKLPIARFDVSPPLRDIPPVEIYRGPLSPLREHEEEPSGLEWLTGAVPQLPDARVQTRKGDREIPAPTVSFDGQNNTGGVNPPDPSGDVGPNHYVSMVNSSVQVFSKTGTSLFGPVNINTLWSGFGGACQTENAGDPIVLHDQFADRWIITQFTAAGPTFFNCVAISQTPDPTGSYYRYAITTGTNFPDYPKYGVWRDSYVITTREFQGLNGPFQGAGAYALNRADMIAGNPTPSVIKFIAAPGTTPFNVGDGLLPADIDGNALPPAGAPAYIVGTMDAGGPYGAPQDALTLWKFVIDYVTPANSSLTLTNTLPIANFDTIYPCSGRACIPQPGTTFRADILSYRQRAMHRLTYRNFGTYESLVTNQSVEAAPDMAGLRWWEIRNPSSVPVIYQDSTYAPGVTDGIHRWMGSAAMDKSGNIALGYSASSGTVFPSVRYTGRLVTDPINTMGQGEGEIFAGTGSMTGGGNRWGDYTTMSIDPVDDCTFWYINEYYPTTSPSGWRIRIGAFKFPECGVPTFAQSSPTAEAKVCAGGGLNVPLSYLAISGFNSPVNLSATGQPAGVNVSFTPNPISIFPSTANALITAEKSTVAGTYNLSLNAVNGATTRTTNFALGVQTQAATAPTLATPAAGATNVPVSAVLTWNAAPQTSDYIVELANNAGFTGAQSRIVSGTTTTFTGLNTSTTYFWRVSARNACPSALASGNMLADGFEDPRPSLAPSASASFTTIAGPGDCPVGTTANVVFSDDMENGAPNWTHSAATGVDTWAISNAFPQSGVNAYRGITAVTQADVRLVSPTIAVPAGGSQRLLRFDQRISMEPNTATTCYDAGILEISTDGGTTFNQITTGITGTPYTGLVDAGNTALAGKPGWCGDPGAYSVTAVDLAPYAGQTVQFRFRLGSDTGTNRPDGWNIDNFKVQSCN